MPPEIRTRMGVALGIAPMSRGACVAGDRCPFVLARANISPKRSSEKFNWSPTEK